MNCPKCNKITSVYSSHPSENGEFRERYRKCDVCGYKFRSTEEIHSINIRVMRKATIIAGLTAHKLVQNHLQKSDDLTKVLAAALTRAWTENMQSAIVNAINTIDNLGTGKLTNTDVNEIMAALELHVGFEAMTAAVRGPTIDLTEALYRTGITEVGQTVGIDTKFGEPDLRMLNIVQNSNLFWIGNSWNSHTDNLFRATLIDYVNEGMSRQQLIDRFSKDFAGLSDRNINYWNVLADHTATKTREMGRVAAYVEADVQYVQIRAHLDSNTTQICRAMHGKIIPVSQLVDQRDDYLQAVSERDVPAAIRAWKMWQESDNLSQLNGTIPKNTGLPPYHFRCRTITVIYTN